jgi:hypothetical protein
VLGNSVVGTSSLQNVIQLSKKPDGMFNIYSDRNGVGEQNFCTKLEHEMKTILRT